MNAFVFVFLGGGIGSALRFAIYQLTRLWLPANFPWATLAVNVIGSFAAGLVFGWLATRSIGGSDSAAIFLMTGVLGGFTTFSAFSIDVMLLWQRGDPLLSISYAVVSVLLAITAMLIGVWLTR